MLACASASFSQNSTAQPPQNVLQLSATGSTEVVQDWLVLTLATSKEGSDAAAVQAQLRQALDAALAEAKRQAQPGQLDVRTGAFGLYPRYGKDGKMSGWQGRAELLLQGRDFARITGTAAKVQSMAISQIGFGLSPEARTQAEGEAQAQAIEQFKARAATLARSFGFGGYTLREVAVQSSEGAAAELQQRWAPGALHVVHGRAQGPASATRCCRRSIHARLAIALTAAGWRSWRRRWRRLMPSAARSASSWRASSSRC